MMTLAVLLLSFAGFASLALSMAKHHRDLFGKAPGRSRELALRIAGWMLLAAALIPAIEGQGLSVGIVLWFGIVTVAALAVAMGLTYGPRAKPASRVSQASVERAHTASTPEPQAAE